MANKWRLVQSFDSTAAAAPFRANAKPCTRKGYPPNLFECDHDGLPIFFDADGCRLHRTHGPNALSEIELSMQKLILAGDLPVDAEALRPGAVPLLSPLARGRSMTRSRKTLTITGITTAESDKWFKVAEHRRARRAVKLP